MNEEDKNTKEKDRPRKNNNRRPRRNNNFYRLS